MRRPKLCGVLLVETEGGDGFARCRRAVMNDAKVCSQHVPGRPVLVRAPAATEATWKWFSADAAELQRLVQAGLVESMTHPNGYTFHRRTPAGDAAVREMEGALGLVCENGHAQNRGGLCGKCKAPVREVERG